MPSKNSGNDLPSSHPTIITISRVEYDTLVKTAREFANLRRNLMRGGVTEDTLAVLTSDESNWQEEAEQQPAGPASAAPQKSTGLSVHQSYQATSPAGREFPSGYHEGKPTALRPARQDWADAEHHDTSDLGDSPIDIQHQHGFHHEEQAQVPPRQQYERMATRTVVISNLPDGATHADVTAAVRGGQLLDIFLRGHDRSVQVSFLHSADAGEFLEHARRHDLYIKNKRVDVRWSDRQFILPGHVASKIGIGATRNLVVRRIDPKLTEEMIRNDLDHIHNLIVIRVTFRGGSCYISTNSVHNAIFARTCMMSRLPYKGSKIEWDADECTQPLEKSQHQRIHTQAPPPKRAMNPMANRFQLLNMDGDDDDEENAPPGFHSQASHDIMV